MKQRFKVLDSWRGVAAVVVALFHLSIASHFQMLGFVTNGGLFVDFFFVLSGFVITHAYMDNLQNGMPFGAFLIRRIGRLWPLHIMILSILVLKELIVYFAAKTNIIPAQPVFEGPTGIIQLIENIFLVQAIGIDHTHSWNGPAWSISTELWAYVVFAILCIFLPKRAVAFASALIATLAAWVVTRYSPDFLSTSFEYGIFRCLYGFFVGHLTYLLWKWTEDRNVSSPGWMEFVAVLIAVVFVSQTDILPRNPWTMIAPLVFAVVVWIFAHETGLVSKVLQRGFFLALGAWSYSIYMLHDFIAFTVIKFAKGCAADSDVVVSLLYRATCRSVFPPSLFSNPWVLDFISIFYLFLVVLFASLTYRFIEVPGRGFFQSAYSKRQQIVTPTSAIQSHKV